MRRVLVVGAGFFGGLVVSRLESVGIAAVVASRSGAGATVRLDAEDEASLRAVLRPGDIVVDTAGPFASRTTRLARAALQRGCDVIDLADSLVWSESVLALDDRARTRGVRLFPSCSAVAAVAGACVRAAGMGSPESVDLFLAPASAETASPATVRAFVASLGQDIRTFRGGRLVTAVGFRESRHFPGSRRAGGLVESAAAVLLPRAWPSLRRAEFWVDPNLPLGRTGLSLAARVPPLAALGRTIALRIGPGPLGRHDGVFAVAVRDASREAAFTLSAPRRSYLIAVEPAVIVAESLARGATPAAGVVLPDAQVEPALLFARLRALGVMTRAA